MNATPKDTILIHHNSIGSVLFVITNFDLHRSEERDLSRTNLLKDFVRDFLHYCRAVM